MNKLERQIMGSVYAIHVARKLGSRVALECYALALVLLWITFKVSVPHVAHNFSLVTSHGIFAAIPFVVAAIFGTQLLVQLALGIGALASVLLFADVLRPLFVRRLTLA